VCERKNGHGSKEIKVEGLLTSGNLQWSNFRNTRPKRKKSGLLRGELLLAKYPS